MTVVTNPSVCGPGQGFDPNTAVAVQGLASNAWISATQLGASTLLADNSFVFAAIAALVQGETSNGSDPNGSKINVYWPSGVFLVDSAVLDLTFRGTGVYSPDLIMRGAGRYQTIFRSTTTSASAAVLEIRAGFTGSVVFEDFGVDPRADVEQDMVHVVATRRTLDNAGGLNNAVFNRIQGRSKKGEGIVFVGGDDYLSPNQFIQMTACTILSDLRASLRSLGQFGQLLVSGGEYSSALTTSSAPSVQLTQDLRQTTAPTAADTTNNFVTAAVLEIPSGTPVRIVGSGLPSGLATGVTYFIRRYDVAQASGTLDRFSFHSSRANLTSNTKVAFGTTGTLGSWYICPLYVIGVGTNTFSFELPHQLADGVLVTVVGSGLPTGLATATNYYVIRVDARTLKLASSRANAIAGISISFSGGTVTTFGLSTGGIAELNPYSIVFSNVTIQNSLQALYCCTGVDVTANLHIENCKSSIYLYQTQITINGGAYANAGNDGGLGVLLSAIGTNSRVNITGQPILSGIIDKKVASTSAPIYSSSSGGLATVGASTTSASSTGILQQLVAASTLDVGGFDFVFVNTSATQILNISSKLGPRSQIKIVAWSGSIVFASGGNLLLPSTPLTLPANACAVFEAADTIGTYILVSKSA